MTTHTDESPSTSQENPNFSETLATPSGDITIEEVEGDFDFLDDAKKPFKCNVCKKSYTKKSSLKEANTSIKHDMSTNDHVKTRKSAGAEITNKGIKTSQNNTKKVINYDEDPLISKLFKNVLKK